MSEENTTNTEAAAGEQKVPAGFGIKRVFTKDLSFEVPAGIGAFSLEGKPNVGQDLNTQINRVDDTHYEVVLKVTVTVKMGEEKVAFLAEVHQAGIFQVVGLDGPQLQQALSTACPQILFPYVRETIDSLAVRGGFAPVLLPQINFDALFMQAVAQAKAQAESQGETAQ